MDINSLITNDAKTIGAEHVAIRQMKEKGIYMIIKHTPKSPLDRWDFLSPLYQEGPGGVAENSHIPLSPKVGQPSPVDIIMTSGDACPTDREKLQKIEIPVHELIAYGGLSNVERSATSLERSNRFVLQL